MESDKYFRSLLRCVGFGCCVCIGVHWRIGGEAGSQETMTTPESCLV